MPHSSNEPGNYFQSPETGGQPGTPTTTQPSPFQCAPGIDKKGLVRDWATQFLARSPGLASVPEKGGLGGAETDADDRPDGGEAIDCIESPGLEIAQIAVGQDLNVRLLLLGNTLEYLADNCVGMMAAASWAQFTFRAFPLVTQWLAPEWWIAILTTLSGITSILVVSHWFVNDWLSRQLGPTATQRTFYCLLWMARPLVSSMCGGACAAVEVALGLSSSRAIVALLCLAIAAAALAVAATVLQMRVGCGETTQCFAVRCAQLILMTAAGRLGYGLWVALARGLTDGHLNIGPPSYEGGLRTYGRCDIVLTLSCAIFFVYLLRRRPQDKEIDLAITDVLQYSVLTGWSTDHCYVIWELSRALVQDPAPVGLVGYGTLYGFLPYEYPTPALFLAYGIVLMCIAALMASLRPNKSYIPVEADHWWVAIWFMWALGGVFYSAWAGYQNGMPLLSQGALAVSLSAVQIWMYDPAERLKMRALPEVVEQAAEGGPGLTSQQKEDVLRFHYAECYIGTPGHASFIPEIHGTHMSSFLGGPGSALGGRSYSTAPYTSAERPLVPVGSFLVRHRGSDEPPVLVQPTVPDDAASEVAAAGVSGLNPVPLVAHVVPGHGKPDASPGGQSQLPENVVCFTPCPPAVSLLPSMLAKAATHPDVLIPVPPPAELPGAGPVAWTGTGFAPASLGAGSLDPLSHFMRQANSEMQAHSFENEIDT